MSPPITKARLLAIAQEVQTLHDRDEALSQARLKSKVEQRDVRLRIGALVNQVPDDHLNVIAEQSGYTVARLRDFALVRTAWPDGKFPDDVSYTPLEELARDPERFDKIASGMSKRDARAARGGKVDTPSRWSAQTKARFIAESMADPEVARSVASDVAVTGAIAKAEHTLYREARDQRDIHDPGHKGMRQTNTGHDIVRRLIMARYGVSHSLDQAMDEGITDDLRELVTAEIDRLQDALSWFRSYLVDGDRSFEQELQALLGEEK